MTSSLTGVVHLILVTTGLTAALVLGNTEQRAAALVVASVVLTQLAVRRHAARSPQVGAASGLSAPRGFAECPSPVAPLSEG
jgi:uncharacterized membrane-anchored protein